ncbi:MAG: adaptor protein MecA [Oscillospiraceae bacterium]
MIIEQLSDICVKFTLTHLELEAYNLEFGSIGRYDANTRTMISNLIYLAENQQDINVNFGSSEVYVEAFSCNNGNCIIYISLIENHSIYKNLERSNFFLCKSDNLNHLIRMSSQLVKFASDDISKSSLYLQNEIFILLIECTKKSFEKILLIVTEFCEYSTKRPTLEQINEYWYCLAQENALKRLSILRT